MQLYIRTIKACDGVLIYSEDISARYSNIGSLVNVENIYRTQGFTESERTSVVSSIESNDR